MEYFGCGKENADHKQNIPIYCENIAFFQDSVVPLI